MKIRVRGYWFRYNIELLKRHFKFTILITLIISIVGQTFTAVVNVNAGVGPGSSTVNAIQSGYRFYENANSLTPGSSLASANTPVTLTGSGQNFRLRTGVKGVDRFDLIDTGASTSCGVVSSRIYCWGDGYYGQLGNGNNNNSRTPKLATMSGALSGKKITAISVGGQHVCVVASGSAYCWGRGNSGQLGNGYTTDANTPVAVYDTGILSGKTVTAISAGWEHTCVVASGAVYCWGSGGDGQLGNASNTSQNSPVAVDTSGVMSGKTATMVASDGEHTCAVASGNTYCWGLGTNGQLGNASNSSSNSPVAVDTSGALSGKTVNLISVSDDASCVVAGGSAYCWGGNGDGQLGKGSAGGSNVPVAVDTSGVLSGKVVTDISSYSFGSCVVADGLPYCWGMGSYGRLGNGTTTTSNSPVAVITSGVLSGKTVVDIGGGDESICAVANDGLAYCWGRNTSVGKLGNNSSSDSNVPVEVLPRGVLIGSSIEKIATGKNFSCAIIGGSAYCWGQNTDGQLGNNSTIDTALPVAVDVSGVLAGKTITKIATGENHVCVVANSLVYCWGDNAEGQVGDGTRVDRLVPVAVSTSGVLSGKTILAISAGRSHTCAIADDYKAYCWGSGLNGRLGNGSTSRQTSPVAVDTSGILSGKTVTDISLGAVHSCVVADDEAYCWGTAGNGQLGNNSTTNSSVPVAVNTSGVLSGKTVTGISSGGDSSCVVADSAVYCWGQNNKGQLGNNSTTDSSVPVTVYTGGVLSGLTIVQLSMGTVYGCVVASDNNAYCWGGGGFGQRGDGFTTDVSAPVAVTTSGVLLGKDVSVISGGGSHTCLLADGINYCFGNNSNGQLGNNSTTNASTAVLVQFSTVMLAGDNTFIAQFAEKIASTCKLQTTGFAPITGSTEIAYNTNSNVANGDAISKTVNDPFSAINTIAQTYRSSAGSFSNSVDIPLGKIGMFDLSLTDNSAPANTTYCIRLAYSDGTSLEELADYAEVTTADAGLEVAIVDSGGSPVASPAFALSTTEMKTACQSAIGTLGASSQRIRVTNPTSNSSWSLSLAPTDGASALWSRTGGGTGYDFNDSSGSPAGCNSGSDGDGLAGQLSINPSISSLTPQSGCSSTSISSGSPSAFNQGVTDSITLLQAGSSADKSCYWDLTGIGLAQQIPGAQQYGDYILEVTITVVSL